MLCSFHNGTDLGKKKSKKKLFFFISKIACSLHLYHLHKQINEIQKKKKKKKNRRKKERKKKKKNGMEKKGGQKGKEVYSTWCSQAVTHLSTNHARRCLTSVIGREPVFSTRYGHRHLDGCKLVYIFIEE